MPAPPDLITPAYLQPFLQDLDLTPGQQANVPALIASASQSVRLWCRRTFSLWTFDELYTVDPPDSEITLRQFPVLAVSRVATDPAPLLTVVNTDPSTTWATAALAATGDTVTGLVPTGIDLYRETSGTPADDTAAFTTNMTIAGLVAAVNALGHGWSAQAATGYSLWPVLALRPPQGPHPALQFSPDNGAEFWAHVTPLPSRLDARTGRLRLGRPQGGIDSPRWGPAWAGETDDAQSFGGFNGVRVVYQAGFTAVPADVQHYTAEAVKAALQRTLQDQNVLNESDGVLSWTVRGEPAALPAEVMRGLEPWVNRRA